MTDEVNSTDTQAIAESMLPVFTDHSNKNKYMALRIANFTVTEAAQLTGITLATVLKWRRDDPEFLKQDTEGLTESKKKLANEFLSMEFVRNFHLALQKDFTILMKAALGETLTAQEHEYLLKIRSQYTPQQLGYIKQLAGEVAAPEGIDFTQLTLTIRREREEILIQKKEGT